MNDEKPIYTEENIRPFNPIEHVRLRPGMYIGRTNIEGLHELVRIVLDDFVDEVLAGYCDHIWIKLHSNHEITLGNNGRGISMKPARENKSFLEILMTDSGIRRVNGNYQIVGGFFGLCLYAVNALSSELKIESACDGFLCQQTYREGTSQTGVIQERRLDETEATGVSLTFRPDPNIFENTQFDYNLIKTHIRHLAYLLPTVTIALRDERESIAKTDEFHFNGGLADFITNLNKNKTLHEPVFEQNQWTIQNKVHTEYTIQAVVAFQYIDSFETNVIGFANTLRTSGGTHTDIIPTALVAAVNNRTSYLMLEEPFSFEEIAAGLTIAIHVIHPAPSYESQTNIVLLNRDVYSIVAETVYQAFRQYDVEKFKSIVDKLLANREALKTNDLRARFNILGQQV